MLVVSNNNSAVVNVAEKLHRRRFGFPCGAVGKCGKQGGFRAFAKCALSRVERLGFGGREAGEGVGATGATKVSQGFEDQTMRAQLKAEYDALLREQQYNDLLGWRDLVGRRED